MVNAGTIAQHPLDRDWLLDELLLLLDELDDEQQGQSEYVVVVVGMD